MISCKLKRHHKKSYFPVVSIYGQPPPSVKFPLRFHTCKHSKQIPVNEKKVWKLLGNLTGGFHEFPHLETVNPRITPCFLALSTSGNLISGFHECLLVKFTDTYLTADFSHTCTMFSNHQFHNK